MRKQVTVECATMNIEAYETITETRYRDMASWDVLVRIETPKLNRIERMLTEMVDNNLPLISVTVASNPNYLLTITKWDDDEIHYSIEAENDTTQDAADQEKEEYVPLVEFIRGWAEGRGYGNFPKGGGL